MEGSLADQLAAKLRQNQEPQESTPAPTTTVGRLAELVEKVSGVDAHTVTADKRLDELGLGSLHRIEVAVRAEEEFGVRIDDADVAGMQTVGDMVEFLDRDAD